MWGSVGVLTGNWYGAHVGALHRGLDGRLASPVRGRPHRPTTPDRHPIIDRLADGLSVALGFAGTGMMHAPAAGLLSAELVLDGAIRSVAGSGLTVSRFDRENAFTETTAF